MATDQPPRPQLITALQQAQLENATVEQRGQFQATYNDLPADVVQAFADKKVRFKVTKGIRERARIEGKTIIINPRIFEEDMGASLRPIIFGFGLSVAFQPNVSPSLEQRAWNETVERIHLWNDPQAEETLEAKREVKSAGQKNGPQFRLAQTLGTMRRDAVEPDKTLFAHVYENRRQVYDIYMDALRQHMESRGVSANAGAAPPGLPPSIPSEYSLGLNLRPEERRFFDAVNNVIRYTYGSEPVDQLGFEHTLKLQMVTQLYHSATMMGAVLKKQMEQDHPGIELPELVLQPGNPYGSVDNLLQTLPPISVMAINPTTMDAARKAHETLGTVNTAIPRRIAQALAPAMKANGLDQLTNIRLTAADALKMTSPTTSAAAMATFVDILGPSVPLGDNDNKRPLLGAYLTGSRRLAELSDKPTQVD